MGEHALVLPDSNQQAMEQGPKTSAVFMVLSGTIPQLLEDIVEYAALPADELCRLASVSTDWRLASEKNSGWESLCQQRNYNFNMFPETPNRQAIDSPMYSRAQWKALYVRMEMIKAKMRNGDGLGKETVEFDFEYADAKWPKWIISELYLFVLEHDSKIVRVYRMATGECVKTLQTLLAIRHLEPSRSGEILVTNAFGEAVVRIWNVRRGVCTHAIQPIVNHTWMPTRFKLHNNRLIMVENRSNTTGPGQYGDVTLRAYDTSTGTVMQSSATIENLGYSIDRVFVVKDERYMLTISNASYLGGMECYTLWDIKFLTCEIVVEETPRDQKTRWHLLDSESQSIVSYTFCDLPANKEDMDSVVVWDFKGLVKLQLQQKAAGDRFTDVIVSQRKLIILQS